MSTVVQDLRYAFRMLLRNPGVALIAVIALALGIGANTAIFSVVNSVLLRSLPYSDPDRLMMVKENKFPQFPEFSISPGNFLDWQKQNTSFETLAAVNSTSFNLVTNDAEPERLRGARVTAGLFEMLGVRPIQGRTFTDEEDQPGHENVAIISEGLWKRRFGNDPNVVGQSVTLSAVSYTIIGVTPSSFPFPDRETDLWTPMAFTARQAQMHGSHFLTVVGRLKQGVSISEADAELKTIAARLAEQYPGSNAGWSTSITPLQDYQIRDVKSGLIFLLGSVALVLLIACANVANLLLARATVRQKEIAIRTALGASRGRVARQLLTESILLAFIGGTVGLALAWWGMGSLLSLAPDDLQQVKNVALDLRVLAFTLAVTVFTGIVFGVVPAIQASNPNLNETLKEGGRGTTGGHHRVRSSLVIVEVALALVLLVCSGLLIRSFVSLNKVSPGFNSRNALTVNIALPGRKYQNPDQYSAFFTQLLEKLAVLPGVTDVGATQSLPVQGDYLVGFKIQGRPAAAPGEDKSTNYYAVTPGYFKSMGIPLIRGRLFTEQDNGNGRKVAIINETMAKTYFADEDPIGRSIYLSQGPADSFREIVGIVGDVKQYGLSEPSTLQTYEPYLQMPFSGMTIVVRTQVRPESLSDAIRREVLAVDKEQPISRIRTLEQIISSSVQQQRFLMFLLSIFAGVAMILAAVGLYGVMSYTVTQRTHEIGIRIALGASNGNVLRLVVGHGMILALTGVAIGLAGSFAVTRLMSTLLFGISTTDAITFGAIPLLLAGVALVSCLAPAYRAIRVDPMVALRHE
jgi:putative ABC transport system permease protein